MAEPRASRPLMPGYGFVGPDAGVGLLPWSWAEERLLESKNFGMTSLSEVREKLGQYGLKLRND